MDENKRENDGENSFRSAVRKIGMRKDDQADKAAGDAKRNQGHVPTRDECLHALAQLPGLVAMKVITPAQGNSIRSTYQAILAEHHKMHVGSQTSLANESVLKILQEQPALLALVEPMLTKDQIDLVMGKVKDDSQRKT